MCLIMMLLGISGCSCVLSAARHSQLLAVIFIDCSVGCERKVSADILNADILNADILTHLDRYMHECSTITEYTEHMLLFTEQLLFTCQRGSYVGGHYTWQVHSICPDTTPLFKHPDQPVSCWCSYFIPHCLPTHKHCVPENV